MVKISGTEVGHTGFGLMGFTWRPKQTPTADAIEVTRKAVLNGAPFLNGGTFYGPPESNSLQLLSAYYDKYPEDAAKTFVSIKAGFNSATFQPDNSPENVAREIAETQKYLDGKKSIDIFQLGRVAESPTIEENMVQLKPYLEKGIIKGIGLSEVTADQIRKAAAIVPITAVEVELSLWCTDILTNGVAQVCHDLNIPVIAYSPLGRGFLTGEIKSFDDLPEGDMRRGQVRFQPANFEKNLELVRELQKLANEQGCTTGQLGLAWVRSLNGRPGMPAILPIPGATRKERVDENTADVKISREGLAEIDRILGSFSPAGARGFISHA